MSKYVIFTDSCCDLDTKTRRDHQLEYVHMAITVDGEEKLADLDWELYSPEEFYGWLKEGRKVKTSQVSYEEFMKEFSKWLEKGYDVLYLACSSALTGSLNVCNTLAKPELLEKYPDRKIVTVDTLLASAGEGMLALKACELRDQGKTIEEVAQYCEDNKFFYNQFATVDNLNFLKAAGRIKGAKAFFGNLMGVKPIIISDRKGNNFAIKKAKGTKNSLEELFLGCKETLEKDKCDRVFIGQGLAMDRAESLKKRIEDELDIPATITWIGPIVGTSCGPGVIAVFCVGKEVTRYEGDGK